MAAATGRVHRHARVFSTSARTVCLCSSRDNASQSLAPLADRALRNLSWKGKRTDRGATLGERPRGLFLQDYSNEASDERVVWSPM
jgi:hypothetical protein